MAAKANPSTAKKPKKQLSVGHTDTETQQLEMWRNSCFIISP